MEFKMNSLSTNPLAKHFRQPILHIKLPSQGKWWTEGSIELPVTGELPVYAMTAKDEITIKTPDALLNGSSTVAVIQSCCPNIKNAWKLPMVDLDKILIAIRIASYGPELEFTCVCPHCNTKNEHGLDISVMSDKIGLGSWDTPVLVDNLEITLSPQSYESHNKSNITAFDEERIMKVVQNVELSDEEKAKQFDVLFRKLIDTGLAQVSKSIQHIKILDEEPVIVNDPAFIKDFLNNCDRSVWEKIKVAIDNIRQESDYTKIDITCSNPECEKSFVTPFTFEQTNFFA